MCKIDSFYIFLLVWPVCWVEMSIGNTEIPHFCWQNVCLWGNHAQQAALASGDWRKLPQANMEISKALDSKL